MLYDKLLLLMYFDQYFIICFSVYLKFYDMILAGITIFNLKNNVNDFLLHLLYPLTHTKISLSYYLMFVH